MKSKVFHKGLIIVLTPLLIELLLIGSLAFQLVLTETKQTEGAVDRRLAILSARLVFSNMHAVYNLNGAVYDQEKFWQYNIQAAKMRSYIHTLSSLKPQLSATSSKLCAQLIEAESFVLSTLNKVTEITKEGLSLANLYRVLAIEDKACKRLTEAQVLTGQFYDDVSAAALASQNYLRLIYQISSAVLLVGVGLNLLAAFFLSGYFRRNFLTPLSVIGDNVSRLEARSCLNAPLPGADEISCLDRSFHEMNQQLILAAEREKALFDNSSEVICVLDERGMIVKVNNAVLSTLGFSTEDFTGKPLSDVLSVDGVQRVHDELELARSCGKAGSFESEFLTADGQSKILFWSAIWSKSQHCWYCILHDISAQKTIEKAQRDLIRLIASEFEQPLLSISSQVQTISAGKLGELSEGLKTRIAGATRTMPRLVRLVADLLQIEDLQGTEISLDHVFCCVSDIIEDSCRDVESAAQLKRITVERRWVDCQWQVDSSKLTRVLVNLLSNAIKFSPEDSTIKVVATQEDQVVLIQVIDSGRGIPAEKLSSLFQPFQQVEKADGQRGTGSGLGLVICKRIVEQHGGAVGVESEQGSGSTFWLRVPIEKSAPVQSAPSAVEQPGQSIEGSSQSVQHRQVEPAARASFWSRWSMRKKGALLLLVPLLFQLPFVVVMLMVLMQAESDVRRQVHDRELTAPAMKLVLNLASIAYSVSSITRDSGAAERCRGHLRLVDDAARSFYLVAGQDQQARAVANVSIAALRPLVNRVKEVLAASEHGRLMTSQGWVVAGEVLSLTDSVAQKVEQLIGLLEERHRAALIQQDKMRSQLVVILATGLLINCASALGLAIIFSRDVVGRLKRLSDNSKRFAERLPLWPPQPGDDEVARLDRDFHATAARIIEQRARERAFMDNASDLICALSETGHLSTYNQATVRTFGSTSLRSPQFVLFDILDEKDCLAARFALEQAKRTGEPRQFETSLRVDNRAIDLLWSLSWSSTERLFFCVAHDVTTRKNLERLKRQFIAIITHDLRSPITSISGMSLLAVRGVYGKLSAELDSSFQQINQESQRVVDLVNDILDLERLDSGNLEFEEQTVDVATVLTRTSELLNDQADYLDLNDVPSFVRLKVDVERLSIALSAIMKELLICQPLSIKVTCSLPGKVLLRIQARHCRRQDAALACLRGSLAAGDLDEPASSRIRWLLAGKIIEAHHGTIAATGDQREVVVEIALPNADEMAV